MNTITFEDVLSYAMIINARDSQGFKEPDDFIELVTLVGRSKDDVINHFMSRFAGIVDALCVEYNLSKCSRDINYDNVKIIVNSAYERYNDLLSLFCKADRVLH